MATIDDIKNKGGKDSYYNPDAQQEDAEPQNQPTTTQEDPADAAPTSSVAANQSETATVSETTPQTEPGKALTQEGEPKLSDIRQAKSYADVVNAFKHPELNMTPEELAREKKRERNRALIGAISDGVSAFANLYATTKGAQGTPQLPSMTQAATKRYEEAIERRRKLQDQYTAALGRAGFEDLAQAHREQIVNTKNAADNVLAKTKEEGLDRRAKEARNFEVAMADLEYERQTATEKRKAEIDIAKTKLIKRFTANENALNRQGQKDLINYRQTAKAEQYGKPIKVDLGDGIVTIGDKTLKNSAGNLAAMILSDLPNFPEFKGKSEKELAKNQDYFNIKKLLDPKRNSRGFEDAVRMYVSKSPQAKSSLMRLSDGYNNSQTPNGNGYGFISDGGQEINVDSLFD